TVVIGQTMAPVTRATFSAVGGYKLQFMAMDGALETSDTMTVTVIQPTPTNRPPVAALTVLPLQGVAPLTVTADASASTDPDGDALTYSFDFGDAMMVGTAACGVGSACCCAPGPCACGHESILSAVSTPTATH